MRTGQNDTEMTQNYILICKIITDLFLGTENLSHADYMTVYQLIFVYQMTFGDISPAAVAAYSLLSQQDCP